MKLIYLFTILITLFTPPDMMSQPPLTQTKNEQALAELNHVLHTSAKFVKAHAAEYLIWTGHPEAPLKEFLKEEQLHATEPKYRIVIWRVLTEAEQDPARKKIWLDKIYKAYNDMEGPDRIHASETLAKLKQPVTTLFPEVTAKTLTSDDTNLRTYALWASSFNTDGVIDKNRDTFLKMALTDSNVIIRKISAYILRQAKGLSQQQWDKLATSALSLHNTDDTYVTFLATALVTAPANANQDELLQIKKRLLNHVEKYSVAQRTELSLALADKGEKSELGVVTGFLNNQNSQGVYDPATEEGADLRAAAAYAILKINNR